MATICPKMDFSKFFIFVLFLFSFYLLTSKYKPFITVPQVHHNCKFGEITQAVYEILHSQGCKHGCMDRTMKRMDGLKDNPKTQYHSKDGRGIKKYTEFAVTGSGSIGKYGKLSQPSWLLGHTIM